MDMTVVSTPEAVDFNLDVLLGVFRVILYEWHEISVSFVGWLSRPFSEVLLELVGDAPLLGEAVASIASLFDQFFGPDFSMLALLSGTFVYIIIELLFVSVVLSWVKLFIS